MEGREGRDEKGGKGVPECPNPELASLAFGGLRPPDSLHRTSPHFVPGLRPLD